jgi:hypothetical protein
MEQRLLICGSAIAVVVLVLASFSPVVGYNSAKFSVRDSPLFSVRTKRAIHEVSHGFHKDYIGKDKSLPIMFLLLPRGIALNDIQNHISQMEEIELNELSIKITDKLNTEYYDKEFSLEQVKNILRWLGSSEFLPEDWYPGYYILRILAFIVIGIAVIIDYLIYSSQGGFTCNGSC